MSITIEPLKADELDAMTKIYWDAFEPLEANMIAPMIYPRGLTSQHFEMFRDRVLRQTDGQAEKYCLCARDTSTGDIIGVARWSLERDPPGTKDEIDRKYYEAIASKDTPPVIEDMNVELAQAYHKASFYGQMETMKGQPHVCLRLLAVRPERHRGGVGSSLVKRVLDTADELGLPVFLDSGVSGKPLYERLGFHVTGVMPLDCRDYGGRSDGRHWYMLRPARKQTDL